MVCSPNSTKKSPSSTKGRPFVEKWQFRFSPETGPSLILAFSLWQFLRGIWLFLSNEDQGFEVQGLGFT